jgi:hypothetical protein
MSLQELRRRAIARALANGGAAAVTRVCYGRYTVASANRPGQRYTVSQSGAPGAGGHLHCTCEAGLAGRPCWHAGAVYVAKVEHAMRGKGRVTGPAASAQRVEAPANVIDLGARRAA